MVMLYEAMLKRIYTPSVVASYFEGPRISSTRRNEGTMRAVISELKAERRRLAKELAVVDAMLNKAGAGTVKRRKRKVAKKAARKVLGRGIAAAPAKAATAKKGSGNGKADELAAKRRRAAELKGGAARGPAAEDTGGS